MFQSNEEVKQYILDAGYEEVVIFEDPAYPSAFIGISSDGRAVYDYDMMVNFLIRDEEMDEEDAADFISYNTLGSLGNIERPPIVVFPVE